MDEESSVTGVGTASRSSALASRGASAAVKIGIGWLPSAVAGGRGQLVALLAQAGKAVFGLFGAAAALVGQLRQQVQGAAVAVFQGLGQHNLELFAALGDAQLERYGERGRSLRLHVGAVHERARQLGGVVTGRRAGPDLVQQVGVQGRR